MSDVAPVFEFERKQKHLDNMILVKKAQIKNLKWLLKREEAALEDLKKRRENN